MAVVDHLTDAERLQFFRKARLLENKAKELSEIEDYEKAGLLYGWAGYAYMQLQAWEDAGYNYGQSGEAYKRIGNWSKAGFSYELSGEAYEKAERWLGAGFNYTQSGYAYEQSKEYEKAGESYRRAGECYRETGKWQEVAISYQQSGEACQIARAWRSAGLSYAQSGDAYRRAQMWMEAEENYCKAKIAYTEAGAYEDAGNMFYKEMLMKRMKMKKWSIKRFTSYLYDLICGYGEKPKNVFITWILTIIFFAIIYLFPSGIIYRADPESSNNLLLRALHSLYLSATTFATLGQSEFDIKGYMRPFIMLEALLGISMITLFILVLGRKMMRR